MFRAASLNISKKAGSRGKRLNMDGSLDRLGRAGGRLKGA
jgi:hypothetical protein